MRAVGRLPRRGTNRPPASSAEVQYVHHIQTRISGTVTVKSRTLMTVLELALLLQRSKQEAVSKDVSIFERLGPPR